MLSLFSGLVQTGRKINVIGEVYLARECAKADCEGSVSKARLVGGGDLWIILIVVSIDAGDGNFHRHS